MRVCEVCSMVTSSGVCLTCGTVENEKNGPGETKKQPGREFSKTALPFDLQESNRRRPIAPVFGLEASPEYQKNEKTDENIEKSSLINELPFGFKDSPETPLSGRLIFGLTEAPDSEE